MNPIYPSILCYNKDNNILNANNETVESMEKIIMGNVKNEKLLKLIIDGMCRYYKYVVEDFSIIHGNNIMWGLSKQQEDGTKKVIHFIDLNNSLNNESIENCICSKFECIRENIVSIILVDEDMSSTDIKNQINNLKNINALQNSFVIVDLAKKEIHTSDDGVGIIAGQVARIIDNSIINQENKTPPIVTYIIMAVNILMFIISVILSKSIFDIDTEVLVNLGAKYNPAIIQGQWFRLITCMFLHGGIIHIAANMYSLYSIGPFVERLYAKCKYIVMYFVCGIVSSVFSFMFSEYVSIGASGAIFGLLGVVLVFALKERKRIGRAFLMNVASVVVMNLIIGLSMTGIDNFAHLGGLLSGAVLGAIIKPADR